MIKNNFAVLLAQRAASEGRRNIPLTEVEEKTGLSWKTLQQWSLGNVTKFDTRTIEALCTYLDCTLGQLLEFVPASAKK